MAIDMSTRSSRKQFKPRRGMGQAATRKRRQAADGVRELKAERLAKERQAARDELARRKGVVAKDFAQEDLNWGRALLRSVVSHQTALLRTWGYEQKVNFSVSDRIDRVDAWTDFKQISVTWPEVELPNRLVRGDTFNTIAQMKGIMQHEMGHLRWTRPFPQVLAGSPLPSKWEDEVQILHTCWNLLEDQRMEALVVETVPRIEAYFGTMVFNLLLGSGKDENGKDAMPTGVSEQAWLMLAGREYLPFKPRETAATLFDDWCLGMGIKDAAQTWQDLMDDYKAAASDKEIQQAVIAALEFIRKIGAVMPDGIDSHRQQDHNGEGSSNPSKTARKKGEGRGGSIMDLFKKGKSKGKGKGQGKGGKGEGEGSGSGSGDKPGKGKEASDEGAHSSERETYGEKSNAPEKGTAPKSGRKDSEEEAGQSHRGEYGESFHDDEDLNLHEQLVEAVEDFSTDIRSHHDMREMAFDANKEMDREGLPLYDGTHEVMNSGMQSRAAATAIGIEEALNSFVTQNAPMWHRNQESGVVQPLRYRTKEVGERDFRSQITGDEFQGLDVHVSLLCDVSYSMSGEPMLALSEALYATGLASEKLGIGSTYTLWSSGKENHRVNVDGCEAVVYPAMGGTDPTQALDDLGTHNPEEAGNHIVIIFTDGAWAHNFPTLQRWAAPGRTFILVRYGRYDGAVQKDMGADEHVAISDVGQLPGQLTLALLDTLASQGAGGWS